MKFPFFTGKRETPVSDDKELPSPRWDEETRPQNYDTEPGLVNAVNVTLLMGQPLLLTGEPGTGKTQLAYRLAWELALGEPLKFETKSNSTSQHLFYYYDTLRRFHAAQLRDENCSEVDFITYNALGKAILLANKPDDVKHLLPPDFKHEGPRRSVVLIDEIDKAPRDFPNDILNEIERMYFRISFLKNENIQADKEFSPIVVITSNSEKNLPDPFLRRCVYYHIKFPDMDRMKNIMRKRLRDIPILSGEKREPDENFLSDAVNLFFELRAHALRKRPATAELLGWLQALREISDKRNPIIEDRESVLSTVCMLIKSVEDIETANRIIKSWKMIPHK
ncbi:MAG: MoxR family ATPase [Desulfobacteraceae bacterium]|nr:MoxR family ATPase [Desulfobacteraceae bacterium]